MIITTEYSNIPHPNIERLPDDKIYQLLKENDFWVVDTETYPKNWDDIKREIKQNIGRRNLELAYKKAYKELATNPKTLEIRLIQIEVNGHSLILDMHDDSGLAERIMKLIPQKRLILHNAKFDLSIFKEKYNVYPLEVLDTYILSQLIEHSRSVKKISHSLGEVIERWLNIKLDKSDQVSDWSLPLEEHQIIYAVNDIKHLKTLARKMLSYVNSHVTSNPTSYFGGAVKDRVVELEMKFIEVLITAELKGIKINLDALSKQLSELKKRERDLAKNFTFNFNSPKQVKDILWRHGFSVDSASKEVLIELAALKGCKICSEILEMRQTTKLIAMIEEYISLADDDGRIYPTFWQLTAKSGRLSASNPNSQQIPRAIKNLFYTDDTFGIDYPSVELRIMAEISQDVNMIAEFKKKDADLHTKTAKLITGKDEITKEERTKAKGANFLFLFGGGSETFRKNMFTQYGVKLRELEASRIRDNFMTAYPNLMKYHQRNGNALRENNALIKRSLYGRRMIAHSYTLANNLPVQGTGADILKLASIYYLKNAVHGTIVNLIHDEIVVEVDNISYKDSEYKILKGCMESAINGLLNSFYTEVE